MTILLVICTFLVGVFIGGFLFHMLIIRAYELERKFVIEVYDEATGQLTMDKHPI